MRRLMRADGTRVLGGHMSNGGLGGTRALGGNMTKWGLGLGLGLGQCPMVASGILWVGRGREGGGASCGSLGCVQSL